MQIKTAELPGVGKKYTIETAEDLVFVIIIHHSGQQEIYVLDEEEEPKRGEVQCKNEI